MVVTMDHKWQKQQQQNQRRSPNWWQNKRKRLFCWLEKRKAINKEVGMMKQTDCLLKDLSAEGASILLNLKQMVDQAVVVYHPACMYHKKHVFCTHLPNLPDILKGIKDAKNRERWRKQL
eukprot:12890600-Prorocentrum_lima.AAC.1